MEELDRSNVYFDDKVSKANQAMVNGLFYQLWLRQICGGIGEN